MRVIGLAAVLALGLALSPLTGDAQQAPVKAPLIGLLDFGAPRPSPHHWWTAFRNALQELGYSEGQNIAFEVRWAGAASSASQPWRPSSSDGVSIFS